MIEWEWNTILASFCVYLLYVCNVSVAVHLLDRAGIMIKEYDYNVIVCSVSVIGWVKVCGIFNVWLHSGLKQHRRTQTQPMDCCTVSGWLIKWCDSFWLIWGLSGNTHSQNLSAPQPHPAPLHTHTHRQTLTALTEAQIIWENGSPFIAFIIIAPSPSSRLHSPSPHVGCYLLPNPAYNWPGNLLCVWVMC